MEFISISRILKSAPAQYTKAYLHTETDDNDLTYFILYHLEVVRRAIDELHTLVGAGAAEGAIDASNLLKPALANASTLSPAG